MNGAEPGATVDAIGEMERDGAIVVQGNTDIAVADGDYAAAFPWMLESGVSEAIRAAAEWAHDALDDDQLAWLRRLPAERRVRIGDDLVLLTHASPGSQTQGFDKGLDPSVGTTTARTTTRTTTAGVPSRRPGPVAPWQPRSAGPSTTSWRPPTRSRPVGSQATFTALRPSE